VSYTNVVLTDTTNDVSIEVGDFSVRMSVAQCDGRVLNEQVASGTVRQARLTPSEDDHSSHTRGLGCGGS
jgi:hypothetical protein